MGRMHVLAAALALAACAQGGAEPGGAVAGAEAPAALERRIEALIGEAACEHDHQCLALPLGHRPCGGPERYAVYSTAGGQAPAIEALARQHRDAIKAAEPPGLVSTCEMRMPPGTQCRAGHCVATDRREPR